MIRRHLPWAALLALPFSLLLVRRIERRRLVPQPRGIVLGLYAVQRKIPVMT